MTRQKDLKKAYQDLDAVLRHIVTLEEEMGKRGSPGGDGSYMLTEYLVIAAVQGIDSDGDASTGISFMFPADSEMPLYRMLGLIDFAKIRLQSMVTPDFGG